MKLSIADIAPVALALTLANGKRFKNYGFMQAARSPQLAKLIAELNPQNAREDGRMSVQKVGGLPKPVVQLHYRPQNDTAVKTSRTVATGPGPTEETTLNIPFDNHRELDMTYEAVDMMRLSKETETYLEQADSGMLKVNLKDFRLLSDMGDQLLRKTDSVLAKVNTVVGTAMLAGAGGNLMIGQVSPDNLAVPTIKAFNADGSIALDPFDFFNNLRVTHHFEGTPIVVGGLKALTWVGRRGIAGAASLGYDYSKAFAELDIEFYFDQAADTLLGTDSILILDPGAACMETIMEHRLIDEGGVVFAEQIANTTYGTAQLSIAQTGAETFNLDMDFRVRVEDTAYPRATVTPSIHFGVFTRPAGYHANYEGWETHTGIFRAKLL